MENIRKLQNMSGYLKHIYSLKIQTMVRDKKKNTCVSANML